MDTNKVGQSEYTLVTRFLSSPLMLIFGILSCVQLAFEFTFLSILGSIVALVIQIFSIVGIFITYTSARRYTNTGQPMTTTGLTIMSGCVITKLVCVCIIFGLLIFLAFIYLIERRNPFMAIAVGILIIPIVFLTLILMYCITYRRTIKALRYKLSDTASCKASMYPVYFCFICAGLHLLIFMFSISVDTFVIDIIEKGIYSVERELNPGLRAILRNNYANLNSVFRIISCINSILCTVIEGIFLLKAKSVTDYSA